MYYAGLIIVFLYFILGMILLFSTLKPNNKNKKTSICLGVLFIGLAFFVLYASIINDKGLVAASVCIPLGIVILWLALNSMLLCKKCTVSVRAKLMGEEYVHRGKNAGGFVPIFKYNYLDKEIVSKPFVLCSKRKFDRLYPKSNKRGYTFTKPEYDIFIDPSNPECCLDKREFPFGSYIAIAVFGAMFMLFGAYLPFAV